MRFLQYTWPIWLTLLGWAYTPLVGVGFAGLGLAILAKPLEGRTRAIIAAASVGIGALGVLLRNVLAGSPVAIVVALALVGVGAAFGGRKISLSNPLAGTRVRGHKTRQEGRDPDRPDLPPAEPTRPAQTADRSARYGDEPILALQRWVGEPKPVLVGHAPWPRGRSGPVAFSHEAHALVVGNPGSGKTRSIGMPALLAWNGPAWASSSKPDLMNQTILGRLELGPVWVVDVAGTLTPSDLPRGAQLCRWHPALPSAVGDWDDCLATAQVLVERLKSDHGTSAAHFNDMATDATAALLRLAHCEGESIEWVLERSAQIDTDGARIIDDLNRHGEEAAARLLRPILQTEGNERSGVRTTLSRVFSPYQSPTVLRRAEDPSLPVFDPHQVVASPRHTLYLVAPTERTEPIASAVVDLLVKARMDLVDKKRGGLQPPPEETILWVADELAEGVGLTRERLKKLVGAGRSRGIALMGLIQTLAQLEDRYGRDAARAIIDAIAVKIQVEDTADQRWAEMFVNQAGEGVVSRTRHVRENLDVQRTHERVAEQRLTITDVARGREGHHLVLYGGHVRWVPSLLTPGPKGSRRPLIPIAQAAADAASWR